MDLMATSAHGVPQRFHVGGGEFPAFLAGFLSVKKDRNTGV